MAELKCNDGTVIQVSAETEIEFRKAFGPKHVWEHGDVFVSCGDSYLPMMYVHIIRHEPRVIHLENSCCGLGVGIDTSGKDIERYYLKNATFLFNIKEKL